MNGEDNRNNWSIKGNLDNPLSFSALKEGTKIKIIKENILESEVSEIKKPSLFYWKIILNELEIYRSKSLDEIKEKINVLISV